MDDVTNYMNNAGKELQDQTFDLRVTYTELVALKAFVQNIHPEYQSNQDACSLAEIMFEELKEISGYAERRYLVNDPNALDPFK
jgi:hypothetical protein